MEDNTVNDFLPIGTVVTLRTIETKPVMITGYLMYVDNILYDYCSVPFPLGYDDDKRTIQFNADAIAEILHKGFVDADYEHLQLVNKAMKKKAMEPRTTPVSVLE